MIDDFVTGNLRRSQIAQMVQINQTSQTGHVAITNMTGLALAIF